MRLQIRLKSGRRTRNGGISAQLSICMSTYVNSIASTRTQKKWPSKSSRPSYTEKEKLTVCAKTHTFPAFICTRLKRPWFYHCVVAFTTSLKLFCLIFIRCVLHSWILRLICTVNFFYTLSSSSVIQTCDAAVIRW